MAQAMNDLSEQRRIVHPIPRYDRGMSARRRSDPRPTLADDIFATTNSDYLDPDREMLTWPEMIDQSRIDRPNYHRFADDDAEIDDGV